MDRNEHLEEVRYFEERAADAMLHLERARNARMKAQRATYSQADYGAMADHFLALAQVTTILKEFRQSRIEVPDYVMKAFRAEIIR